MAAGWDTCPTFEALYESALKEKEQEKKRREGVEKELAESNLKAVALKRELSVELAHEEQATRQLEEAKQKARNMGNKEKMKDWGDVQRHTEKKMAEMEKAEREAEEKLQESEQKLAQAEKQLQEEKSKAASRVKDAEIQWAQRIKDAEQKVKAADLRHHEDVFTLSDTELRLHGMQKKFEQAGAIDMKLRGATKDMLKFKAASEEANKKLSDMTRKLLKEEILEKDLEVKLSDTEKNLAVAQKKAAEADAELRPFRTALNSAIKTRVLGKP